MANPAIKFSASVPTDAPVADATTTPAKKLVSSRDAARQAGRERKRAEEELAAKVAAAGAEIAGRHDAKVKARAGDLTDGTGEYKLVLIDDLHPDPDQPRKTFRDIAQLAASLKAVGMLQPITARIDDAGGLVIMYGERRWRAALEANWQHVPVIIRHGVPDSSVLARQLTENFGRDAMDPIDEARGLRRYMQDNRIATHRLAAEKLGHSQVWVSNRLALLDLDETAQTQVSQGKLSILEAVKTSRKKTGNTRTSKRQQRLEVNGGGHFSDGHPLAGRARSRCRAGQQMDKDLHWPMVGGIACGACWETMIRIDESVSSVNALTRKSE